MNNQRLVPTRKAPSLEDALRSQKQKAEKKKPPPRPPPPNFEKLRSKSAWNLNQQEPTINLIEWSPPASPKASKINGSISSSYSSSTSSLASSKKSFESESNHNDWLQVAGSTFYQKPVNGMKVGPTIIRPQPKKVPKLASGRSSASTSRDVSPLPPFLAPLAAAKLTRTSPPMPNIPPPSPPKILKDDSICVEPFGIALYDYSSGQIGDLEFQADDIVYLLRNVNEDWFYGRVDDREGMFPKNYLDIQIPFNNIAWNITGTSGNNQGMIVKAIFDFQGQLEGDLSFHAGDLIKVERVIDSNWLYGICNGNMGQFPANFVHRMSQS